MSRVCSAGMSHWVSCLNLLLLTDNFTWGSSLEQVQLWSKANVIILSTVTIMTTIILIPMITRAP